MLIGFYSPDPQSGKSTVTRLLAKDNTLRVFKVSGAMKAMCAAAISGLVEDTAAYVDGAEKDSPIPALTPDVILARLDAMTDALIEASGGTLLVDEKGDTLTRDRLKTDLETVFVPALFTVAGSRGVTARDIQKVLGLEWGRRLYGLDFWLKPLAAALDNSDASLNIVDDARFPDDAQFVTQRDGLMVKIERPTSHRPDNHPSEGLLDDFPFDLIIVNDKDLDHLETIVRDQLIPLL